MQTNQNQNQTGSPFNFNGDTTLKEAALQYGAAGYSVIPLHHMASGKCSCGKPDCKSPAKHPMTINGLKDASTDQLQIERWWTKYPQANVGVCTGAVSGGLVVVDIDSQHGGLGSLAKLSLSGTLKVETGNGFHLWYHSESQIRNSAGKLGQGIDVRGIGGYVVAPPSIHYSGKQYSFINNLEIAEFPNLGSPSDPPAQKPEQKPDDVIISDTEVIERVAPSGNRNNFLTAFAGKLRSMGLDEYEIETSLLAVNQKRCQPPLADSEVRKISKSVSRYSPSQASRIDDQVADASAPQAQTHTSQQKAQTGLTALTLDDLLLTIYGEQEQILTALYKGDWGIIAALPNLGKSTFMLNLSIALASGRPFIPFTTEKIIPRKILYLDYEASEFRLQSQLYKMLEPLTPKQRTLCGQNLHFILHPQVNNFPLLLTERGSIKLLYDYIKAHGIDLVIIDTLAQATWLNDENNNSEVQRKVVMPMSQFVFHTKTAVLLIHHEGKGSQMEGENYLQFRTRGASALVAGARYQITMVPDDPKSRKYVKFHCSKDKGEKFEPVVLEIDHDTRWFGPAKDRPPQKQIVVLEDHIIEVLESHTEELSADQLLGLIPGTSRATMFRKLKEMVDARQIIKTRPGKYRSAWLGEGEEDLSQGGTP